MYTQLAKPYRAILLGVLLALPFIVVNAIVAMRIEPLYSFLGSIGFISASPLPLVPILILLGLAGAVVAALPMLIKDRSGQRRFYLFNAILAVLLLAGFLFVGVVLGEEIYRCEVLAVPNCD